MRAVLDTGVVVSAFLFPGTPSEHVYRSAVEGRIEVVTSRSLLTELGRILSEAFRFPLGAAEALAQIVALGTVVEPTRRPAVTRAKAERIDGRVLEAAAQAGAEVIVSGDRRLLRLSSWRGIRVVAPSTFLAEFG